MAFAHLKTWRLPKADLFLKTPKYLTTKLEKILYQEEIIKEFKRKIESEPHNIEYCKDLANYYVGLNDLTNALHIYEDILRVYPDDFQSLINAGSIYFYKKML